MVYLKDVHAMVEPKVIVAAFGNVSSLDSFLF